MLKVVLTGGIGAGKTTVAKIFVSLGIPVFFSDIVAKHLQMCNANLIELMKKAFGLDIYDKEGSLKTKVLADRVFNNKNDIATLNKIVHPFVFSYFEEWLLKQNSVYIIKETALPFIDNKFNNDINILVRASEATRIDRVMYRNKLNRQEVMSRINNQINFEDYTKFADFIIYNDKQALIPQVINIHKNIIGNKIR